VVLLFILLFVSAIYPTMRYELREKEILLKCGPFVSQIGYGEIKRVSKIERIKHFWGIGVELPGYLFGYIFSLNLYMYATGKENILIIETADGKKYGVTPRNETEFMRSLNKRLDERLKQI